MAYTAINIEGGMFPPDLLDEIGAGQVTNGQKPSDFGIGGNRRITDEIQSAFSDSRVFWDAFQRRMTRSNQNATTLTRQNWMVPLMGDLLSFNQLNVQQASADVGGQSYFISHRQGEHTNATPIHIVSLENDLDHRNAARRSPHALVQEYLNRSDALWGMVSNGRTVRLLRDSVRLSKPTYLEFDLEGMLESNLYNEFSLFYRIAHATRFPKDPGKPDECLLEDYYQQGINEGTRIRDKLRDGVENALRILGTAFIKHPGNGELRARIDGGILDSQQFYRQLLRLIYRFLFLMVAEERKLIVPEGTVAGTSHTIYNRYYSVEQLRQRADRYFHDDDNTDLWQGLRQTFRLFRDDEVGTSMGMSALNGELFGENACRDLEGAHCTNNELLRAIRELSVFRTDKGVPSRVNYAGLDVEELGSVYEGLLEFHPVLKSSPPSFNLATGSERKETGSYYTPPDLVHELINSALVPVIEDRVSKSKGKEEKEKALLSLRVCDPSSGSGHFMLAAARRIARELSIVREGESEPTPTVYREALRDVIRSCIYAIDKNPLAVDLCKVALWIEGHNAGLPLSFLDNHIKCGDSLVGVLDIGVLDEGIPDDAYKAVSGDDKAAATTYRKQNQEERKSQRQLTLGEPEETAVVSTSIADDFRSLGEIAEQRAEDVGAKEDLYDELRAEGSDWWKLKLACDVWTAAFFMPLQKENAFHMEGVPTTGTLRRYLKTGDLNPDLLLEVGKTSEAQSFFHWKLEFPDVFEQGGFDVVLGNPPWERIKVQEKEFFAGRDREIAEALNKTARSRLIKALPETNPQLAAEFANAVHTREASSKFIRGSERVPLTGRGDINTYSIFAETMRNVITSTGRMGVIVPSGIATDETTKYFFSDLVAKKSLVSLFDFENSQGIFPGVHRSYKFCLLTLTGSDYPAAQAEFAFFMLNTGHLYDPEKRLTLSAKDFALFNPNTRTCPIFRTRRDSEITRAIYEWVPVLVDESKRDDGNPWGVEFKLGLFNMSSDSELFQTREQLESQSFILEGNMYRKGKERYLPLYEAKLVHQYDHRWASYEGDTNFPTNLKDVEKVDPLLPILSRYWISQHDVETRLQGRWQKAWMTVWRDICRATDVRTTIPAIVPRVGIAGAHLMTTLGEYGLSLPFLVANMASYIADYIARQKVGGIHLSFNYVRQLPILPPATYENQCKWAGNILLGKWLSPRIVELTYTAWDMQPFAKDLSYDGPPFRWDEERRFLIRCELDASFFHLYGIERDDIDYIMETFPIVKRHDERDHGEYRIKRVILEIYDDMAQAIETGQPYQTRLDPPPADLRVAHKQTTPV